MIYLDNPAVLPSHFFWKRYWAEHSVHLNTMNDRRNHLDTPWAYPSSSAQFWKSFGKCPVCDGSRLKTIQPFQLNDYITLSSVYCVCSMLQHLEVRDDTQSKGRPFDFASFKFTSELVDPRKMSMKKIVPLLLGWTKSPFSWLYLWGPKGSGKSSAMSAIKNELGSLAYYITMPDLQAMAFDSVKGVSEWTTQELTRHLAGVPVLMIDDIGLEHQKSDFTYSILAAVIDRRYNLGRVAPVVVSSNLSPDEITTSPNGHVSRAADRILDVELGSTVFFNQKSYRTGI